MSTPTSYVTLMMITDTGKAPTSIKMSRTTFRIVLAFLALVAVAVIVGALTYSRLLTYSLERGQLAAEVESLKRYTAKVDELEKNLEAYRQMLKRMTDLAGVDLGELGIATMAESAGEGNQADWRQGTRPAVSIQAHPEPQGFPVNGYVSRSFRPNDQNPKMRHYGVDIAIAAGTPVTATADGVIAFAGWDSTFGWQVVMTHVEGLETVYGHNDSLLVEAGDTIRYGDVIAISGSTGVSTAPHLHYEIRKNGSPVNPEDYGDKSK